MSTVSTHFKLGLFALIGAGCAVVLVFGLGMSATHRSTIRYETFFDESVQGLELGAPVKYRGIVVGNVENIAVAPDRRLVDVTLGVDPARASFLASLPPDSRAQLGTQGITGVKFVDIDMFDPRLHPAPTLPFPPPERYIPATPSLLKKLEINAENWAESVPQIIAAVLETLKKVEGTLGDLHDEHLATRIGGAVDEIHSAAGDLRTLVRHVDGAKLPDKTATALDALGVTIANLNAAIERITGEGGLLASTQNATDNLAEIGRRTGNSAQDLERTLRDLREAAEAVRELARDVDRDPDMLVSGRARRRGR